MFLGLSGYYRKMIPNYSTIAAPLTDLTTKSAPNKVIWSTKCRTAFQTLKKLLCSPPVLKSPDFSKTFYLQTDASDRGIGAVFSQKNDDREDHPVAFYSRKLTPREQKFSTVEKECLTIKLSTQAFRTQLLGRTFVVQTDHCVLQLLDNFKENNPKLCRWSLSLQPFHFTFEHHAGAKNANADALSRT